MDEIRRQFLKRFLPGMVTVGVFGVLAVQPTAQANAPPCRYTISTDTVFDNDTGLEWQRVEAGPSYTPWSDGGTHCTGLSLAGSGWRLPTIQELQTIVDEHRSAPAADSDAFPNTQTAAYWSSSLAAGDSSLAWNVDFYLGYVGRTNVGNKCHVRCVR